MSPTAFAPLRSRGRAARFGTAGKPAHRQGDRPRPEEDLMPRIATASSLAAMTPTAVTAGVAAADVATSAGVARAATAAVLARPSYRRGPAR